jgi:hypothetical protein
MWKSGFSAKYPQRKLPGFSHPWASDAHHNGSRRGVILSSEAL